MLDETLRRRVASIAAADQGGLDDAARERVLSRLVTEGPGIVRRARRVRFALVAAGPLLAAAAAAAIVVRHPGGSHGPSVAMEAHHETAPAKVPGVCAGRAVAVGAGFVAAAEGAHLDLGATATAVADPSSDVRLAEVAPCRTVIALGMGRVTVHAKDLGGGELRVHARDGEVVVHGTIFAVTQAVDSLTVEVAEGRVEVDDRLGQHWVSTGERLLVSAVGVAQGALDAERSRALRGVVGAPLVVGLETLEPAPVIAPGRVARMDPAHAEVSAAPTTHPGNDTDVPAAGSAVAAVVTAQSSAPVTPEPADEGEAKPATPPSAGDLLTRADEARHAGDYGTARDLYRRAAGGSGPTAEAAWVALARMELSLGHAAQAREATKQRQEHFGQGTLAPEALWIDVRSYRQTGDLGRARALADELVRRWPSSPQARAATQWLSTD